MDLSTKEAKAEIRQDRLKAFVDKVCASLDSDEDGNQLSALEEKERADAWAFEGKEILLETGTETISDSDYKQIENYFRQWEEKQTQIDNREEFALIESFVLEEQDLGRSRRGKARILAASEEVRLAAEVAELKGYRSSVESKNTHEVLRNKISDVERGYVNRKMVLTKAAQVASSDCRKQFTRVRQFFQELQNSRQKKLKLQYERLLKLQSIFHRLRKLDSRVMALEQNTASRLFKKREADLNEINMYQNLEEAMYLETIIDLLDKVQEAKETAAHEHFKLQIQDLKTQQEANQRRDEELSAFKANATLEMAKLVAHYVEEDLLNTEEDGQGEEQVSAMERRKGFRGSNSSTLMSVSELYDTILWSVATSQLGLSTDGDSLYSSVFDGDQDAEDVGNLKGHESIDHLGTENFDDVTKTENVVQFYGNSETGSTQSGSTFNTTSESEGNHDVISPIGNIHVKQLTKDLRREEKAIIKRHAAERKQERRRFRQQARDLKRKHQTIVDKLLEQCVDERHRLRDAITQRMNAVKKNQEESLMSLQGALDGDVSAMQGAWKEHKRLEDEQKNTFAKAQALISAQVFHEVRNALSSVVAMSEMTSSLQQDPTVSSEALVSSVNGMLGQNKEVVDYSLNMLNNILDVSKIKAGSFETNKKLFDLQDLVSRATKMQLVKAQTRGVKMSFSPLSEPQIAFTDEDIVVRIVTNFISNAVKFTKSGAVQPFICPLESIDISGKVATKADEKLSLEKGKESKSALSNTKMKMVAVGVADTGPGLSRDLLNLAKSGLFSSDSKATNSGAKNSGFGLHLAHQLAGTLDTEVFLTDLDNFHDSLCNDDMSSILKNTESARFIGRGTVLYITVPVLADGYSGLKFLNSKANDSESLGISSKQYTFCPKPATDSVDGIFRILVADDVSMLRKGLMRSIIDIFSEFPECPVSVSTACTAEDALRALKSQPYDLFICDNQFAAPDQLKRLSPEFEKSGQRPQVLSRGNKNLRASVVDFFANEQFTIEDEDGSLAGLDALFQLVNATELLFPIPVLILHSGHEITLPKESGILVVQKPLKRAAFVPIVEGHASNLIESGLCEKVTREGKIAIVNKHGSQIFIGKDFS